MKDLIAWLVLPLFALSTACGPAPDSGQLAEKEEVSDEVRGVVERVLTAEEQAALTPEEVLDSLLDGNQRFVNNDLTARDHSAQVRKSTGGQYPKAVVLSCLDSRIPVEDVFDKGIGDMFVARVAGNFVNPDILGSMEFGCKVAGAKLILVMGHEHCGAVKAAVDGVELGNITSMLANLRPAVEKATAGLDPEADRSSGNAALVHDVCVENVLHNIERIRKESPILREMEEQGAIRIAGAVYDMDSGRVEVL